MGVGAGGPVESRARPGQARCGRGAARRVRRRVRLLRALGRAGVSGVYLQGVLASQTVL